MNDLLEEIRQDVQREKFAKLWTDFGKYVIAAAVGIVVATAIYVFYTNHQLTKNEKHGGALFFAMNEPDPVKRLEKLSEVIATDADSYSAIAGLNKAEMYKSQVNYDEAIKEYDAITSNKSAPRELTELAIISKMALKSNQQTLDADDLSQLQNLVKKDSPWKLTAMELQASNAIRNKNYPEAKKLYEAIESDEESPDSMRSRAENMLSVISTFEAK